MEKKYEIYEDLKGMKKMTYLPIPFHTAST